MKVCSSCGTQFEGKKCKPCHNISAKKYRDAYPDRVKNSRERFYAGHQETVKKAWAAYYFRNREKIKGMVARWRKNNRPLLNVINQNRKARLRRNGGVLSNGLSEKLFRLQRGKCACCGLPLGKSYHLDHRMPISLGGKNEDWNMQLLRQRCNNQKSAKHPVEFMQSRGFLL